MESSKSQIEYRAGQMERIIGQIDVRCWSNGVSIALNIGGYLQVVASHIFGLCINIYCSI